MDPSALIFIALAVAWAAYLLPQAIKQQDRVESTRSVDRFSGRVRVLARREPTSSTDARLVVPGRGAEARVEAQTDGSPRASQRPTPAPVRALTAAQRREAANRAARRRRTVLGVILLALLLVGGLALAGLFSFGWTGAPAGVLVAWLVACRQMVKRERYAAPVVRSSADDDLTVVTLSPITVDLLDESAEAVDAEESRWDMVPVTLPTYVTKPAAEQRAVSTIDLESTGVWTSGRTEVDAEIARRAEAERRETQRASEVSAPRAVGS